MTPAADGDRAATAAARGGARAWLDDRRAVALIVLAWAAVIALCDPRGDFPLNDDWAYAASARRFAAGGGMRILDWAAPSLVSHVAWGALAIRLLGPSYTVLRCGTLAFALAALLLVYALGRRAALEPASATVMALAVGATPWFVNLSFSYMTDVPWLAMVLAATVLVLGAPTNGRRVGAGLLLGVAALTRQFALVLAPAFALLAALDELHDDRRPDGARGRAVVAALAAFLPAALVYAPFHLWYTRVHLPTLAHAETWLRIREVRWWHPLVHLVCTWHYAGLWLLPLSVAVMARRRVAHALVSRRLALVAGAVLVGFAVAAAIRLGAAYPGVPVWHTDPRPSSPIRPTMPYLGNLLQNVALGPPLLFEAAEGVEPLPHPFPLVGYLLAALSSASGIVVAAAVVRGLGRVVAHLGGRLAAGDDPRRARARTLLVASGALYLAWTLTTSTFVFDRYLVPLLPLALLLGIDLLPRGLAVTRPALVTLAVVALLSVAGQREYLAWNRARAAAVHDLAASGVPDDDVDAGFEWNGARRFERWFAAHHTLNPPTSYWAGGAHHRLSFHDASPGCVRVASYPYWTWGIDPQAIHVLRCATPRP